METKKDKKNKKRMSLDPGLLQQPITQEESPSESYEDLSIKKKKKKKRLLSLDGNLLELPEVTDESLNPKKKKKSKHEVNGMDISTIEENLVSEDTNHASDNAEKAESSIELLEEHFVKKKKKKRKKSSVDEEPTEPMEIAVEALTPKKKKKTDHDGVVQSPKKKFKAEVNGVDIAPVDDEKQATENSNYANIDLGKGTWSAEETVALLHKLREMAPAGESQSHRRRLKKLDWSEIAECVDGRTAAECEEMYFFLIQKVCKLRNLHELVNAAIVEMENPRKNTSIGHIHLFIRRNKEMIKQQSDNATFMATAWKLFRALSSEERAKYNASDDPESSSYVGPRNRGKGKPRAFRPRTFYVRKMAQKNKKVKPGDYFHLSDHKMLKYIKKAVKGMASYVDEDGRQEVEHLVSLLSQKERRVYLEYLGMPILPHHVPRVAFRMENQPGEGPEHTKAANAMWAGLTSKEKKKYSASVETARDQWEINYPQWLEEQSPLVKAMAEKFTGSMMKSRNMKPPKK